MPATLQQALSSHIALALHGDAHTATYRYDASLPKPCVHPLTTPAGVVLTGFEMSDHVWHRGLWFTIKFINATNYWEEHAPFGRQLTVAPPHARFLPDTTVELRHEQEWSSDATGRVLLESRMMRFHAEAAIRFVDFSTSLTAQQDLLLDRTPYTTWGGYSGLTYRASRELHNGTFILPSGEKASVVAGDRHPWLMLHALADGGPGRKVSLGIIDHPSNPRSDGSGGAWYGKAEANYTFFNAAFLFHESMRLAKGQSLNFRYRVIYADSHVAPDHFNALANAFRNPL
jgi:hypothetical protein